MAGRDVKASGVPCAPPTGRGPMCITPNSRLPKKSWLRKGGQAGLCPYIVVLTGRLVYHPVDSLHQAEVGSGELRRDRCGQSTLGGGFERRARSGTRNERTTSYT